MLAASHEEINKWDDCFNKIFKIASVKTVRSEQIRVAKI